MASLPNSELAALQSIQFRFLRQPPRFHALVNQDPRLTHSQRECLLSDTIFKTPSELYYWFVLECLPYNPLRVCFRTENCRKSLLYGSATLICGHTQLRIDSNALVRIERLHSAPQRPQDLFSVLTEHNKMWVTSAWCHRVAQSFHNYCVLSPEQIITHGRDYCPFCHRPLKDPASHSLRCMKQYVLWNSDVDDINTFSQRQAQRCTPYNDQGTSATSKDSVSKRACQNPSGLRPRSY